MLYFVSFYSVCTLKNLYEIVTGVFDDLVLYFSPVLLKRYLVDGSVWNKTRELKEQRSLTVALFQ